MWEIILKEPIKFLIASPIYQLEVLRIEANIPDVPDEKDKKDVKPHQLNDAKWIRVEPLRVFATQHSDWIDLRSSAINLRELFIPAGNIAGLIRR